MVLLSDKKNKSVENRKKNSQETLITRKEACWGCYPRLLRREQSIRAYQESVHMGKNTLVNEHN